MTVTVSPLYEEDLVVRPQLATCANHLHTD